MKNENKSRIEKIYSRNSIYLPFYNNSNGNVNLRTKNFNSKLFKILIIIIIAFFTYRATIQAINPIIDELCINEIKNLATKISNEQASIVMNNYTYDDLVNVVRDSNGDIAVIQTNTKNINQIISDVPLKIIEELNNTSDSSIQIYLGSILGMKMFSAKGPKINIQIANVGNVDTKLMSEFESKGINQTLHKIYLELECEATLLTPYNTIKQKISNQILIAESIIIGNVPDAYYNLQSGTNEVNGLHLID